MVYVDTNIVEINPCLIQSVLIHSTWALLACTAGRCATAELVTMQGVVSGNIRKTMLVLQKQLSEYHSLLDELTSTKAKFQQLENQNQHLIFAFKEQDSMILSLDHQLAELKRKQKILQLQASHSTTSIALTKCMSSNHHLSPASQLPTMAYPDKSLRAENHF